jgi:hypothetical protein
MGAWQPPHTEYYSRVREAESFEKRAKNKKDGAPMERFQEIDPGLGAINAGAKITQLGAVNVGAKPPCHLADDVELALTWQHLGAVTI